jgi:hypothetical protein
MGHVHTGYFHKRKLVQALIQEAHLNGEAGLAQDLVEVLAALEDMHAELNRLRALVAAQDGGGDDGE